MVYHFVLPFPSKLGSVPNESQTNASVGMWRGVPGLTRVSTYRLPYITLLPLLSSRLCSSLSTRWPWPGNNTGRHRCCLGGHINERDPAVDACL